MRLNTTFEVFFIFLKLGVTSFGGPVAHLGFFQIEFVEKRKWISQEDYLSLVSLCQMLPGPASSQVGMALGQLRAGYWGSLAAWTGFTLPSALILILAALGISHFQMNATLLSGLKTAAVAIVAHSLFGMIQTICKGFWQYFVVFATATIAWLFSGPWTQISLIIMSAIFAMFFFKSESIQNNITEKKVSKPQTFLGFLALTSFVLLLGGFPSLILVFPDYTLELESFYRFYRAGSLVFGGGHVILPLLEAETVKNGLISSELFVAGYGLAQAIPGPLFTFAAYLGASSAVGPSGWSGGLIALIGAFLPAHLLIVGALPIWQRLQNNLKLRSVLFGVNSCAVGLLGAVLISFVIPSGIKSYADLAIALIAFGALYYKKLSSWQIVAFCGGLSFLLKGLN